tara:strand:- start:709 stop:2067 length:1359 start_codon:yes stop_codon:yes gene_type:complete
MTKHRKRTLSNWGLLLLLSISFTNGIWSQNSKDIKEDQQDTIFKTQAEKDWEHLDYMKGLFATAEQSKSLKKANAFEYFSHVDKVNLNRSRLAKIFLNKYPDDEHFAEVLSLFFSVYFMPTFIQEKINEDHTQFLSKFPRNSSTKEKYQVLRTLPIDEAAKERWLIYGNDLVTKILASNASPYRKGLASIKLMNRDFQLALKSYKALPKEPLEADYWEYFDTYYWRATKQDLRNLIETYPDFEEGLTAYIPGVLNILKKEVSPKLAKAYMKELYIHTGNSHPLSDRIGIKALHQVLGNYLKALDIAKEADDTKSLDMVFTAIDGTEIDLSRMKGKVVLIDFWSIGCAPCIKEMPHFRALYDKYRDQGFEIIGLAAEGDNAKNMVMKIMEKTGANWPQRLDKGSDATVSFNSLYNITIYPTVWLLDKEGKIVDRNARGKRLEPLIRKYLGLDN